MEAANLALFKLRVTNSLWLTLYLKSASAWLLLRRPWTSLEYSWWCKSHSLIVRSFSSWTAPNSRQFFLKPSRCFPSYDCTVPVPLFVITEGKYNHAFTSQSFQYLKMIICSPVTDFFFWLKYPDTMVSILGGTAFLSMYLFKYDTWNWNNSLSAGAPAKHTCGTITVFILGEIFLLM